MYKNCEALKKYVDMIGKTNRDEEALEVVAKIILDSAHSKEIQDAAMNYVNNRLEYAAMDDNVCKKM